ncbi:nitrate reductase molybdenum cofactor assembly chaperone [Halomonas huangheensis]|uniref:Nitrate reductase molybdenum cofactor assembly chaperone n=1 Tax=Halomonas huangheensis TaxID=1178482 RepID=W1NAT7_9GAMM|nr:nitrate reductase molybdenum cofactor assembly chaperone [Halomonas huangheensis]ALM53999.1 nitrate reductase [Halomonas huangheensis]ERL52040.1 hypothetical protein BJB45_08745 [Halomonas huangheensis]
MADSLALGMRALARMLDYPTPELVAALPEIREAFERMPLPSAAPRRALLEWSQQLAEVPLLESQAAYVALFDRGRSTSLLLFEHVHGESRDRGQAMVDLLRQYEDAGFVLDRRELPDYLPLFLEYLSTLPGHDVAHWLGDISHILALLTARLETRDSRYALVPHTLLSLIGEESQIDAHRDQAKQEPADNTPAAIDAVWEEEAVRFSAESDEDCALQSAEGQRLAERRNTVQPETIRIDDLTRPNPQPSGGVS